MFTIYSQMVTHTHTHTHTHTAKMHQRESNNVVKC